MLPLTHINHTIAVLVVFFKQSVDAMRAVQCFPHLLL
jgi:hypothetical protein